MYTVKDKDSILALMQDGKITIQQDVKSLTVESLMYLIKGYYAMPKVSNTACVFNAFKEQIGVLTVSDKGFTFNSQMEM